MVTNPAAQLRTILEAWWAKDGSVQTQRLANGKIDWARHREALECLFAVEEYVNEYHPGEYDRLIRRLWQVIIAPQASWGQQKHEPLNEDQLLNLSSLAKLYASDVKDSPLSLSSEARESLRQALEEMGEVLRAVPDNFHEDRDRLLQMISECLTLVSEDGADLTDLRSRTNEIAGAALPVAVVLPEEQREHFLKAALRASGAWVSNATAGAVGGVLASGATPLIVEALAPGSS